MTAVLLLLLLVERGSHSCSPGVALVSHAREHHAACSEALEKRCQSAPVCARLSAKGVVAMLVVQGACAGPSLRLELDRQDVHCSFACCSRSTHCVTVLAAIKLQQCCSIVLIKSIDESHQTCHCWHQQLAQGVWHVDQQPPCVTRCSLERRLLFLAAPVKQPSITLLAFCCKEIESWLHARNSAIWPYNVGAEHRCIWGQQQNRSRLDIVGISGRHHIRTTNHSPRERSADRVRCARRATAPQSGPINQ